MWVSKYFVYFVVYSCMGWIYETIYCTIKGKKWENRGFLYGPVCPIYGAGAVAITAIADNLEAIGFSYTWWQVFIVAFFGSIVLEYGTSWTLEKLFHAYWWDYSNIPLNIKGRVCFPCSVGFGFAGLIVVYWIAPFTRNMFKNVTPVPMELISLVFMGLVAVDTALTVSALTNFARTVTGLQDSLNNHMDAFVGDVVENVGNVVENVGNVPGAVVENMQEKKQAMTDKIAEEKERFSRENMELAINNMGATYRSAVKRVEGFKLTTEENQFAKAFEAIKKRVKR